MKAIKKVSVTPLNDGGKVIDSLNTTDDKHLNAPSFNVMQEYFDDKILTGTEAPSNDIGKDGDIYFRYYE